MRAAAIAVALAAACGGSRGDPTCARLIDHLAPLMGSRSDQRDDAIAACERHRPSMRAIDCAMAATTPDQARACMAPEPKPRGAK